MPNCPCLNVGTPKRPIYMPIEVCVIAPAQRKLRLNEMQTAEMIKSASRPPGERAFMIERAVNEIAELPNDPHAAAFGMEIERHIMTVQNLIGIPLQELSEPHVFGL